MNTRILTRLSVSVSLLFSLVACSDATQFAEQTLPAGALDAARPGAVSSETPAETDGSIPSEEVINEDDPTGVRPDGTNPDDSVADNGSGGPGSGTTGTNTNPTAPGTGTGGPTAPGTTPPPGEVFSECSAHPDMAIVSQLYQLPPETSRLPDFSRMRSIGDVCVGQLNIADRDFTHGFPGVSDIFEWFALDMRFKITISKPGTYQFFLNSDDGSILSINNAVVIDNDGTHSQLEKSGSTYLGAGVHDVRVRYYQGPRTRIALELFWKVPGSNQKVYVPKSVMSRP